MKNKTLLEFVNPERSFLRYMIGTAALTVVVQILYDLAKTPCGILGGIILALLLIGVVGLLLWIDQRNRERITGLKLEDVPINPHPGLIMMISPHNKDVPLKVIEHHQLALKHCWLVATKDSLDTAIELAADIRHRWPSIRVHDAEPGDLVDPDYSQGTWQRVENIYVEAREWGLKEDDIVADITGGLKPMTAGMAIACLPRNRPMQYLKTIRDEEGKPIPDAPTVVMKISIKASGQ